MRAVVNDPVCPLLGAPTYRTSLSDEALLGFPVEILEEAAPGWVRLRTHYRYEGFAPARALAAGEAAARWAELPKLRVCRAIADVLSQPRVQGWNVTTLPRGAVVAPLGEPDGDGWQKITLPDGREGYIKCSFLGQYYEYAPDLPAGTLRRRIADAALSYLGVQYRWGGKSPLGIDCSGLTSMAYLLNGILIFRDARIEPGFPIHEIPAARMDVADLLYFPGHVALYLGEGKYVHATARTGSDGVVVNSLRPEDPDYRADLPGQLLAVGSYF